MSRQNMSHPQGRRPSLLSVLRRSRRIRCRFSVESRAYLARDALHSLVSEFTQRQLGALAVHGRLQMTRSEPLPDVTREELLPDGWHAQKSNSRAMSI